MQASSTLVSANLTREIHAYSTPECSQVHKFSLSSVRFDSASSFQPFGRKKMVKEYGLEDVAPAPGTIKPCSGLREELKDCLLASDCVKIHKKSMKECLKSTDSTAPTECASVRQGFFECKRSLLDNRQRFRGRKGY